MSTLGGIYNFDGLPVERRNLVELAQSLVQRGPDGGSEVCSGAVGMVYRAFHTNNESRGEIQPLISNEGHILSWDGRLDNREELIRVTAGHFDRVPTDVELVMKAFQKWRQNFVTHILGDFALALWDAENRILILARDPAGPRPLFYQISPHRIVWSSELSTLLDLTEDSLKIEDEYVAGYLTGYAEPTLTPYRNICAVDPGTMLFISNGTLQIKRYWKLNPDFEIRYKTDEEYEEHFREVFREAVRCRLRTDKPVWAQLSGGLDSSSIVSMADRIISDGDETPKLDTVSYVYDESFTSDERNFIRLVEERRQQVGHYIWETEYPPLSSYPEETLLAFPDFLDCFVDRHNAMCTEMRAAGARVLLTGHGGDEILCSRESPSPDLSDHLAQYDLIGFCRSLRKWNESIGTPYSQLLLRDGFLPLLPTAIRSRLGLRDEFILAPWFDDNFARKMNLSARRLGPAVTYGFALPSGREQARSFLSAVRVVSRASYRIRGSIEVSHPYLHRPLVEFLQAVPLQQRVRPNESRSLQRRSLRNLLPEETTERKTKRGPGEALLRSITRDWERLRPLFDNPRVCSHGYMKRKELLLALERARHGCQNFPFALIQTFSLEFWLRALEKRSSRDGFEHQSEHSSPSVLAASG